MPYNILRLLLGFLFDVFTVHCSCNFKLLDKKVLRYVFFSSLVFDFLPLYIASTGIFYLLQYYIAAAQLFCIVEKYCLKKLRKHFHWYYKLLLNSEDIYFSIFCTLCLFFFTHALVCLCVCIVLMLRTAYIDCAACMCCIIGTVLNKIHL